MAFGISGDLKTQAVLKKHSFVKELVNTVHGSGIDYDWRAEESDANIRLRNAFHLMDENGYYYAVADFTVLIPKKNPRDFKIQYPDRRSRYYAEKHWLTDYLYSTIEYALESALKKYPPTTPKKKASPKRRRSPWGN